MARRNRTANASPGDPLWTSHLKPAPGELRIVQAFVNTEGDAKATDEIASPRGLAAWLERWRLLPPDSELTADEHARALAVRGALRALAVANGGTPAAASAMERLDAVAAATLLVVRFDGGGASRLEPAGEGLAGALGRLLAIVVQARADGLWPRLKQCANAECRLLFFDQSPNRSARWCAKGLCGNLVHSRTFRRRHPGYYDDF
jgi:predicted RNA-binding Zn ribbon-like protein